MRALERDTCDVQPGGSVSSEELFGRVGLGAATDAAASPGSLLEDATGDRATATPDRGTSLIMLSVRSLRLDTNGDRAELLTGERGTEKVRSPVAVLT